ncbi:hypothetical protein BCR39DRAFT_469840 [Naematelia encephala]|uniref:SMP-30/Gluconolactonase/LRE-like region domain-containing protein n=1 Tax=Naematelia encephala TaxID=71784 RepID=A0A1Y2AX14_9TREE|nr:hypothetical protein BCR39DRAFT_469840 [Naematelia encephala]
MVRTVVIKEPLLKLSCALGEGCIWDTRKQRLFFVDIDERKVFTYEPRTGIVGYQTFDRKITALALLEQDDGVLGTAEDGMIHIPNTSLPFPPTGENMPYKRLPVNITPPKGFNRFNEACVDPTGTRFLCGTMGDQDRWDSAREVGGTMYALQSDGYGGLAAPLVLDNITCSNGMGWTEDLKTMYFTDSFRKEIANFDYDVVTGVMSNRRIFNNIDEDDMGWPDGMCMDNEYGIWSARWGAGKVIRFAPDGQMDIVIEFPKALNMTCCIFGGKDMDELYVTSASAATSGDSVKDFPDSGHVFLVKGLGFRGPERTRFKGLK